VAGRSTRSLDVMRAAIVLSAVCLIAGCAETEKCRKNIEPAVDVAFGKYLAARGVKFKLDPERGVCVAKESAGALDDAHRQVTEYGAQVAALASDECELRQLVEWAKRENLAYQVLLSTKSDGMSAGSMFIVRSLTPEEVVVNGRKLREELPKIKGCKPPSQ
jgi:outer membrane murein-binding lipoprotein Lpp